VTLVIGPWIDEVHVRYRNLGRISTLEDDACFGFEEQVAGRAAEQSPRHKTIASEDMSGIELLLEVPLATRAPKLPVEDIHLLGFRCEDVLVPLDKSPSELRIHLLEDSHKSRIAEAWHSKHS